jgi:hypothetical protein
MFRENFVYCSPGFEEISNFVKTGTIKAKNGRDYKTQKTRPITKIHPNRRALSRPGAGPGGATRHSGGTGTARLAHPALAAAAGGTGRFPARLDYSWFMPAHLKSCNLSCR